MTVFSVSFRLVLLALKTLLDRFRDTRVPLYGVIVVLFDAVLFLVWSNNEFPLYH
jgi:hypothetical protein